jgi:hypothetical protein
MVVFFQFLGCQGGEEFVKRAVVPTDVQIMRYHVAEYYRALEEFTRRLYLKNPKYEQDREMRQRKINGIFHGSVLPYTGVNDYRSHELLEAAFAPDPPCEDRVFLLGLGLTRSVDETYDISDRVFVSSIRVSLKKLEHLYHNISHVNWRLKVYRDEQEALLFITNEAREDGYINMGYEVIMTEIMTRIKDDIFLRGGTPPKLLFNMSTIFLSIVL